MTKPIQDVTEEYRLIKTTIMKYFRKLFRLLTRYDYTLQDVSQECFLRMFEVGFWEKYDPERAKIVTFRFRVIRSVLFSLLRYCRRKKLSLPPEKLLSISYSNQTDSRSVPESFLRTRNYIHRESKDEAEAITVMKFSEDIEAYIIQISTPTLPYKLLIPLLRGEQSRKDFLISGTMASHKLKKLYRELKIQVREHFPEAV